MTENDDSQARTWGMLAHLSSLVWIPLMFLGLAFPVVNILGPLIIWLAKKNEHPFIDEQGKESLNFQISVTLYSLVVVVVAVALSAMVAIVFGAAASSSSSATNASGGIFVFVFVFGLFGMFILGAIVGLIELVIVIFAAVKANNGESYRYPLTIRLLK